MATMTSALDGASQVLAPHVVLGRSPRCDLPLADPRVSSQHAELRWTAAAGWELKDLGSRNGTRLDGQALEPGHWTPLREGATLQLGDERVQLTLADASPPRLPMAVPDRGGAVLEGEAGMLLLPDDARASACVRASGAGWVLERDEDVEELVDECLVIVEGEAFRLYLPAASSGTLENRAPLALSLLRLRFHVSLDEENVQLYAAQGGRELDLEVRVHHYMLLTLARQRLSDREAGVPAAEEGWVYRGALMKMLGVDRQRLNLEIYRARRQLAGAGIAEAEALVERRPGSQELRLGVADVEVRRG